MNRTIERRIPQAYTGRKGEWVTDGFSISATEYPRMVELYGTIIRTYQRFFPEVYTDPKVQKLDIYRGGEFGNGGFTGMGRVLHMDIGSNIGDADNVRLYSNYDSAKPEFIMSVPRHIGEIILMSHEVAHGIFVQTVNPDSYDYRGDSNGAIEFLNIEEGFASVVGNMFLERLLTHPETLNLSEADRKVLIQFLAMRQSSTVIENASQVFTSYKEGIRIITDVYNDTEYRTEGTGDPGLLRIKELLNAFDSNTVLDRHEAERREDLYYTLLSNQSTQGATSSWIKFIKDKRIEAIDGGEDIDQGTFFDE